MRTPFATILLLALSPVIAPGALAQNYPAKPVRMLLALTGGAELAARAVAEKLSISLGQPFVVEAQGGAGGAVGAEMAARAAPDGYTILMATPNTQVYRTQLVKNMTYDPIKDFTPITKITDTVLCVVAVRNAPANDLRDLMELARKNPGKIAYSSSGIGTGHHFNAEQLQFITGTSLIHVPHKSGQQQVQDLLGGQLDYAFTVLPTVASQVSAGKLKVLAFNLDKRLPGMPDVPTIKEQYPNFDGLMGWMGYFGPAGLPTPIRDRLRVEIIKSLEDPGLRAKLAGIGLLVSTSTPDELGAMVKRDLGIASKIAKQAKIEPE
jgi:tripartite-type tricarboxylate transporter receptor subunit TctC